MSAGSSCSPFSSFKPIQNIPIPGHASLSGGQVPALQRYSACADYSCALTRVLSFSLAPQRLNQEIAFLGSNAAFRDHAQDSYALLLRIRLRCTGCSGRIVSGRLLGSGRCWGHRSYRSYRPYRSHWSHWSHWSYRGHWRYGRYRGDRRYRNAQVTDGTLYGLQGSRHTLRGGTTRLLFAALQAFRVQSPLSILYADIGSGSTFPLSLPVSTPCILPIPLFSLTPLLHTPPPPP